MNRSLRAMGALVASFGVSFLLVHLLAYPVLEKYPRLAHTMGRFAYTEHTLILFFTLVLWVFYLQWEAQRFSVVYLYLTASVYLFLLFVVLFTKARSYHAVSWNPIDFISTNPQTIKEAVLNVLYFIPLGMLYGFQATMKEFFVIAFVTILGIETIQYVFYLGTFGISDILLNLFGSWIGYQLFQKMRLRFE